MKKIKIMAAIMALLTCITVFIYLSSNKSGGSNEDTVKIVVAVKPILSQTKVTSEMIETKSVPASTVIPNTIQDPAKVVGKIVKSDIFQGEAFITGKLYDKEISNPSLALTLPKGKRAITIMTDIKSSLSGLIKPGNFVDVIAIVNDETNKQPPKSKFILEKLEVLATGQAISEKEGKEDPSKDEKNVFETATLAVTPEEALTLALCDFEETKPTVKLQLVLRPQDDKDVAASKDKKIEITDIVK